MKVIESNIIKKYINIINQLYENGWAERNAGNVSYLFNDEEINAFSDLVPGEIYPLQTNNGLLKGRFLLISGTGKFFRTINESIEENIGIVKILEDGSNYQVYWGLKNTKATSEISTHLYSHQARIDVDKTHKVIIHTHATYINMLSRVIKLDEKHISKTLWGINSENIVIFPEGVGVIPWIVPGNKKIGEKTAKKFKKYRVVLWPLHGVVVSGDSLDNALGLIETVEKAAKVYIKTKNFEKIKVISDKELIALTKAFNVEANKEFLNEKN